jgi:hypothetical protein
MVGAMPRGALEQLEPQALLQLTQGFGNRRLRNVHVVGNPAQAAEIVHGHQQLQVAGLQVGADEPVELCHFGLRSGSGRGERQGFY